MRWRKKDYFTVMFLVLAAIMVFILGYNVGEEVQRVACEQWHEECYGYICTYCYWEN